MDFLAEFEHPFDLPAMIERLANVAVRTPSLPARLRTIAETHGQSGNPLVVGLNPTRPTNSIASQ